MKESSDKINWGILGPGKIATLFAEDIQKVSNARLYACASTQIERANQFSQAFKIPFVYGSYAEMLNNPDLDVVYVATPHVFHYQNTLQCLRAGKAVLCEKPFAINTVQVNGMIKLATQKNLFLMEAMWTRFLPHFQFVLEMIREQKLGALRAMEADFCIDVPFDSASRIYNNKLGGGSLLDLGIYPVFAALMFMGKPDDIQATATLSKTNVDLDCQITFDYKNGRQAKLFSAINQETPTTATLHFEGGKILMNSRFHQPSTVTVTDEHGSKTHDFGYTTHGYSYEAQHVTSCLLNRQKTNELMTHELSVELISTLDAIRSKIGLVYPPD
ncbi:MAG: Gfo/Idh/MocA family oxidoreductase [Flavobacteriaceae bacterium]|nr:Gfo/Idh/MocA family oxidoreductase [Flavobacteriaceae bacterium]